MQAIILADINAHAEESRPRDEALADVVSLFLAAKGSDAVVRYVTSMQQLERAFQETEPLLLVTNFPPDSTYDSGRHPELRPSFGTVVHFFPADSYYRTMKELASILSQVSSVRVIVITGAPRNALTDEQILSASGSGGVYIVRKQDLFNAPEGYDKAYTALVVSEVARTIAPKRTGPEEDWRRTQAAWQREQVGQSRILVLCRSETIGEAVARGLAMSFSEVPSPLVFVTCDSIEGAHKHLLDGQIEIVLSVFDTQYWAPIHDAVHAESDFLVSVAVADARDGPVSLPPPTLVIVTDPTRRIDVQRLASTIFRGLHQTRSRIQQPGGLADLQKHFLRHLDCGDFNALARALRALTAHHRTVLNTLAREENQLKLFLPVGNARDLGALIRKAVFIADLTVFTQLPPTQSRSLHGQTVQVMPLWDLNGVQYGSLIHSDIGVIIRQYAPLFASDRAFFYPSPTVIPVDREHADELMPGSDALFNAEPSVRVWQERALYDQHISADKIAGDHAVIAEYRRISKIGKAVAALEIPYVSNVSADVLDKLLRDNGESLSAFRIQTKRVIDDLIESQSDIESGSIVKRFRRELEDGARELRDRISTARTSAVIQHAGGAILTTVSTLTAVSLLDLPTVAAKLVGGGLGSMAIQYLSYLLQMRAMKRSPYHIVWQLQRKAA